MRARICPTDNQIAKICDTEQSRYALNSVHAQPAEHGKVYLAATDGRVMAVTKANGDIEGYDPKSPPLVPSSAFPKNGKERKAIAYLPPTDKNPEDDTRAIEGNGSGQWTTPYDRVAPAVEGRYPRYSEVLPETYCDSIDIALDVNALKKLSDALTDDTNNVLTLHIQPATKGIKNAIAVSGTRGIGIVLNNDHRVRSREHYESFRSELLQAEQTNSGN